MILYLYWLGLTWLFFFGQFRWKNSDIPVSLAALIQHLLKAGDPRSIGCSQNFRNQNLCSARIIEHYLLPFLLSNIWINRTVGWKQWRKKLCTVGKKHNAVWKSIRDYSWILDGEYNGLIEVYEVINVVMLWIERISDIFNSTEFSLDRRKYHSSTAIIQRQETTIQRPKSKEAKTVAWNSTNFQE